MKVPIDLYDMEQTRPGVTSLWNNELVCICNALSGRVIAHRTTSIARVLSDSRIPATVPIAYTITLSTCRLTLSLTCRRVGDITTVCPKYRPTVGDGEIAH